MSTQKELELKFKNAAGQSRTLNIRAPKEGVTKGEVDTAMQAVLGGQCLYFCRRRSGGSGGRTAAHYDPGAFGLMDISQLFDYIRDFGFPMILSWYLLVRIESKLAGLTQVIGELSCTIAALRS